ncbi:hypothetical protein [Flavobacterium sp. UBA6031]|uniref:hypothetical protein n=1 Tax=Flavobacterium sp. UBA6031 TaxID=1946551 RepID=UPI0025C67081|nr:hypothetical protein [Flavobacterium sp. UBA6031]
MGNSRDDLVKKYIAKKIIFDILNYELYEPDEFYLTINTNNFTSFLRAEIRKEEYSDKINKFAEIIKSNKTKLVVKELCLLICKNIRNEKVIKDALYSLYNSEKFSISLIYTMLDYEDLELDYHKSFFNYLKNENNWTTFENESKNYNSKNVIDIVEQRLENIGNEESYMTPETKHWIYWCALLHSQDREGVEYFIKNIKKEEEKKNLSPEMKSFREEVIEFILDKNKSNK